MNRVAFAAALACALTAAGAVEAGGGKGPKVPPPPPDPKPALTPLPPGCARVTDGRNATLSPDGKWLAFARANFDRSRTDKDGNLIKLTECWVRELATKKETKIPFESNPVAWTSDGVLLLRAGFAVNPTTGEKAEGFPSLPSGIATGALAWARDGKQLAYIPVLSESERTSVQILGADGKIRAIDATKGIRTDQTAILAFAPPPPSSASSDASPIPRLFVNALFEAEGGESTRRVGIVDLDTDTWRGITDMPDDVRIPGLHGNVYHFRDVLRGGMRIEGEHKIVWKRPPGPRLSPQVWDGTGRRVAWIDGHAYGDADAFVADAVTGKPWRISADGETKWCPALDAAGRRLAFLMADDADTTGRFSRRRARIVDLATGESNDVPVAGSDGIPGALSWVGDGTSLVYEIEGGAIGGIFTQTVAPPKATPDPAAVHDVELDVTKQVLAWLASPDEERAHAAIHRADDSWDEAYVPAARAALSKWGPTEYFVSNCLLPMLARHSVKAAVPELRAALSLKRPEVQIGAARILHGFGAKEALPDLNTLRGAAKSFELKVAVAGAVAGLGDARAWDDLKKAAQETAPPARLDVLRALARLRDPRSVDLVIPWVSCGETCGFANGDTKKTVGTATQAVLTALTGQSLGSDPAAWTAWWTGEAKKKLPEEAEPYVISKDLENLLGD